MNTRRILGYAALAIILAAGFAYTQYRNTTPPDLNRETITVVHEIEGVLPAHSIDVQAGSTALDVLREEARTRNIPIGEKEYAGIGSMIEQIGEFKNGTEGKYWTYTVDSIEAAVGAGAYVVEDADVIRWKFSVPEGY